MTSSPPPDPWPRWQRIAFRYVCLHWLLYVFPAPLDDLLRTTAAIGRRCLPGDTLPAWAGTAMRGIEYVLSWPEQAWIWLTNWLGAHDMTFGVHVMEGGWRFGDSGHGYVRLACIVVLASLLTVLWTLAATRSQGYPRLGRWLHLGARWHLALTLFGYGLAKFGQGQFRAPDAFALTDAIGDQSRMGVLWNFMGISDAYQAFTGMGELCAFALLLHRRTTLLGCVVAAGVMSNVCVLNWTYDVPLRQFTTHLLLIALALMTPFRHRLWALFVSNRESPPVDLRVVNARWSGGLLAVLGWAWVIGFCGNAVLGRIEMHRQQKAIERQPELCGVWNVERMVQNGADVPHSDAARLIEVAVNRDGRARVRTLAGWPQLFHYAEDLAKNEITLTPTHPPAEPLTWSLERSRVLRKAANPAPRTRDEMSVPIDVEREAIVFRGTWGGKPIELHTVRRVFPIDQPFRWVQQYPK